MSFTPEQVRLWCARNHSDKACYLGMLESFLRDHNALDEPKLLTEIVVAEFPGNARLKQLMKQQQDALDEVVGSLSRNHSPRGHTGCVVCAIVDYGVKNLLWAKPEGWK